MPVKDDERKNAKGQKGKNNQYKLFLETDKLKLKLCLNWFHIWCQMSQISCRVTCAHENEYKSA
jgi:hypothetical protein